MRNGLRSVCPRRVGDEGPSATQAAALPELPSWRPRRGGCAELPWTCPKWNMSTVSPGWHTRLRAPCACTCARACACAYACTCAHLRIRGCASAGTHFCSHSRSWCKLAACCCKLAWRQYGTLMHRHSLFIGLFIWSSKDESMGP